MNQTSSVRHLPAQSVPLVGRTKRQLSRPRQQLLALFQLLNFGRIEGLRVVAGEPVLEPRPRIVSEVKFAAENGPRPETGARDFLLKSQLLELFANFDELQNATIDVLEVKHGLPFRMLVSRDIF